MLLLKSMSLSLKLRKRLIVSPILPLSCCLLWPLGFEGAVPLGAVTIRRRGSMLSPAESILGFWGKGHPFCSRQLGRISWAISLCCKNRAVCCRSAVRPSAWLLWSRRCSGLRGWRLCSFTLFSAEIKSLFVFQIYGKVLNCLSLIALGNPILCCWLELQCWTPSRWPGQWDSMKRAFPILIPLEEVLLKGLSAFSQL